VNVEVLQSSLRQLPLRVEFGECEKPGERFVVDLAAIITNTSQQPFSRRAEGSVLPAGILFSGIALPPLKYPLKRVINDPPVDVELCYEAI
jgi:hypothetical protein